MLYINVIVFVQCKRNYLRDVLYTASLHTNRYVFFLNMFKKFIISRPAFFQYCFESCYIKKRWLHITKSTNLSQSEFLKTIEFVSSMFFIFNNSIYKQTFDTPMRSPVFSIVADIVMQDFENYTLNALKLNLLLYVRYMDDIVLIAPTDKIDTILNMFSSYHSRLQFALEYEFNHGLSFLLIFKKNDKLINYRLVS